MVQTVTRAAQALRCVASGPRSLSDVAGDLGVHRSTALRLLQTLEHEGLVRRLANGRYVIGFGVIPLAESAIAGLDIRATAHPHLERLVSEIGHTVHLAQLIDGQLIYVDKVEGPGTVAMGSRLGQPTEIHTAAVAKIILSLLPETERARIIDAAVFRSHGPRTITDPAAYRSELQVTRQRGWAEDDGEKEDFINCVAVPVHDASGRVSIGLSVTALRVAAPLETLREMLPRIRSVADAISADLGWRRPPMKTESRTRAPRPY